MGYDKTKKLSEIDKITESTKVKVWVDIINKMLDEGQDKEYVLNAYSVPGKSEYDFSDAVGLPSSFQFFDGNYIVTYGGIVLQPDDYSLIGKKLIFTNGATPEEGYLITVRYEGRKNEIRI